MTYAIYDREDHNFFVNKTLNGVKFSASEEDAKLLSKEETNTILFFLKDKYPENEFIIVTEAELKQVIDYYNFKLECNKKFSGFINEECTFYTQGNGKYNFRIIESDDKVTYISYSEKEVLGEFHGRFRLKKNRPNLIDKIKKAIENNEDMINLFIKKLRRRDAIMRNWNGWDE